MPSFRAVPCSRVALIAAVVVAGVLARCHAAVVLSSKPVKPTTFKEPFAGLIRRQPEATDATDSNGVLLQAFHADDALIQDDSDDDDGDALLRLRAVPGDIVVEADGHAVLTAGLDSVAAAIASGALDVGVTPVYHEGSLAGFVKMQFMEPSVVTVATTRWVARGRAKAPANCRRTPVRLHRSRVLSPATCRP